MTTIRHEYPTIYYAGTALNCLTPTTLATDSLLARLLFGTFQFIYITKGLSVVLQG